MYTVIKEDNTAFPLITVEACNQFYTFLNLDNQIFRKKSADLSIRLFSFVLNFTQRQHDLCYVISCQQERNFKRIKINPLKSI